MAELELKIKTIQEKLQLLLKQHAALQKENARLKEALDTAGQQAGEQQKKIDLLKQQVDVLKISSGGMNEAEKKELEKKINLYLKEIDKAITLLSE
mgnify:CR=1 FL=1